VKRLSLTVATAKFELAEHCHFPGAPVSPLSLCACFKLPWSCKLRVECFSRCRRLYVVRFCRQISTGPHSNASFLGPQVQRSIYSFPRDVLVIFFRFHSNDECKNFSYNNCWILRRAIHGLASPCSPPAPMFTQQYNAYEKVDAQSCTTVWQGPRFASVAG
jgi:hypothetical protein